MVYCDGYYCYNDNWYIWGRWVLLGAIVLFILFLCLMIHCVNRRRMKRGGAPYRYTGWTVPMYNNPQQQYNYPNTYNMNSYPQGQGGSYQGQPQHGDYENNAPVYYDATRTQADGYQAPSYPPPVGKPPVRD